MVVWHESTSSPVCMVTLHFLHTASPPQDEATGILCRKRACIRFSPFSTINSKFLASIVSLGIERLYIYFDQEYSNPMKRVAILGASRGLGLELAQSLAESFGKDGRLFLSSRKVDQLLDFKQHKLCVADFTKVEDQSKILEELKSFQPEAIYYVSGGGPYGDFHEKEWKDHMWAYQLNLLFPSMLAHFALNHWQELKLNKLVFVGSSIAEDKPDPKAASYCSAKHGLKGLIETLKLENPEKSIHIFSPGYMDTEMLPPNAEARNQSIATPRQVATEILKL